MEERLSNNYLYRKKTYLGNCEFNHDVSCLKTITYLSAPTGLFAAHVQEKGSHYINDEDQVTQRLLYLHKDHLGSITTITDDDGTILQELSYDAWGNLRNPATWSGNFTGTPLIDRGFTGHEHLYDFGLINMNGRMYDPVMSSFLSVDSYVQDPENSQNFNRYAYCLNNPLRYTDPSGEVVVVDDIIAAAIVGAIINGVVQTASGHVGNFGDWCLATVIGGAAGAAGALAGGVAAGTLAGCYGGAVSGAVGGAAGGFIGGAGNTWMNGGSFGEGLMSGLGKASTGFLSGGLMGGLMGGISAWNHGGNFWNGVGGVYAMNASDYPELWEKSDFNLDYYNKHIDLYEKALEEGACSLYDVGVGDVGIERLSSNIESTTNSEVQNYLKDYTINRQGYISSKGSAKFGITVRSGTFSSEVFISPRVVDGYLTKQNIVVFDATIRHEFTHAWHRFNYGDKAFRSGRVPLPYSEWAAKHVTKNVYYSYGMSSWGNGIQYFDYPKEYIVPANYKFSILNFKNIYY